MRCGLTTLLQDTSTLHSKSVSYTHLDVYKRQMSIYGAIVQFVRKQNWSIYVIVGGGLLMVPVLWALIQKWAGVTIL